MSWAWIPSVQKRRVGKVSKSARSLWLQLGMETFSPTITITEPKSLAPINMVLEVDPSTKTLSYEGRANTDEILFNKQPGELTLMVGKIGLHRIILINFSVVLFSIAAPIFCFVLYRDFFLNDPPKWMLKWEIIAILELIALGALAVQTIGNLIKVLRNRATKTVITLSKAGMVRSSQAINPLQYTIPINKIVNLNVIPFQFDILANLYLLTVTVSDMPSQLMVIQGTDKQQLQKIGQEFLIALGMTSNSES